MTQNKKEFDAENMTKGQDAQDSSAPNNTPPKTFFQFSLIIIWVAAIGISYALKSWLAFVVIVGLAALISFGIFLFTRKMHVDNNTLETYDQQFNRDSDNTAKHDDVWGG